MDYNIDCINRNELSTILETFTSVLRKGFESTIKGTLIWYSVSQDFLRLRFKTDICESMYVEISNFESPLKNKRVAGFYNSFLIYMNNGLSKYIHRGVSTVIVTINNIDGQCEDIYSKLKLNELNCLPDELFSNSVELYCKVDYYTKSDEG